MAKVRMGVASDHAGLELKRVLVTELERRGFELADSDSDSSDSCDYRTSRRLWRPRWSRERLSAGCSCAGHAHAGPAHQHAGAVRPLDAAASAWAKSG